MSIFDVHGWHPFASTLLTQPAPQLEQLFLGPDRLQQLTGKEQGHIVVLPSPLFGAKYREDMAAHIPPSYTLDTARPRSSNETNHDGGVLERFDNVVRASSPSSFASPSAFHHLSSSTDLYPNIRSSICWTTLTCRAPRISSYNLTPSLSLPSLVYCNDRPVGTMVSLKFEASALDCDNDNYVRGHKNLFSSPLSPLLSSHPAGLLL